MIPVASLRPDHQGSEAGKQAIPGLTARCGRPVHNPTGLFTALMGLCDAPTVITPRLISWPAEIWW